MTEIYWFQHDLRLQDNPGLLSHCHAQRLLLVYFWPSNRPWCNVTGMGNQRQRFLLESLHALKKALAARGQSLLVLKGDPESGMAFLARQTGASLVGTSRSPGYHERHTLQRVANSLQVPLKIHEGNTLFSREQLPFAADQLPAHFTPFRDAVYRCDVSPPAAAPMRMPKPPAVAFNALENASVNAPLTLPVRGGTAAGQRRLQQWMSAKRGLANYKQTRDCLDGLDGSSTLSPWLAQGCLSAREVLAAVREQEQVLGKTESTSALIAELLWREFFHWRALRDDVSLFKVGGAPARVRRCTFEPRNFARWCQGDTNYPLVNALMRQLLTTGWMSNRGRQIAASCLVNELGIEWRYGAAFFEKHLIDFDVASNYGNWQYLAGVGADPRGGRHFNLQKQTQQHDPQGHFISKWGGMRPKQPDFVTDAADWPLPGPVN